MKSDTFSPIKIPFSIPIAPDKSIERFVYVYAIYGDRLCLIDTGVAGSEKTIAAALQKTGRDLSDVEVVILTHSHPDHIGSAAMIRSRSEAAVWAHRSEQGWIEDTVLQGRERPVPGFADLVSGPVKVDRLLEDGDVLSLGDAGRFRVLHTPGHSSGSISLADDENGILFCGDVIPQPGGMPIYEDVAALAASLVRIAKIDNLTVLYSSWADPLYGGDAADGVLSGIRYLKHIHEVVIKTDSQFNHPDAMELCKQCVRTLGLPPFAENPLVARSLLAHRQPSAEESMALFTPFLTEA